MTYYETRGHIGADGKLVADAPAGLRGEVRVWIEQPASKRLPTVAERSAALRRLAGAITDPTFERPPQGRFEEPEPLD